jgi:hypothetical protein
MPLSIVVAIEDVELVDSRLDGVDAPNDVVDAMSDCGVSTPFSAAQAPIVNVSKTKIAVLTRLIVASFLPRVPLTDMRHLFGYAVDCRRPE